MGLGEASTCAGNRVFVKLKSWVAIRAESSFLEKVRTEAAEGLRSDCWRIPSPFQNGKFRTELVRNLVFEQTPPQ